MADTLLIHLNPGQDDNATWSLVNSAGELATMLSSGSLDDAAIIARTHQSIVLIDSAAIHLDSVKLPIKNQQKLLRAIPFALEEKVADDVEDLHFVVGKTDGDGITPVAIIKRDTLKNILDKLNQAGIEPVALIPDALCLTANPEQWAILQQKDTAKVQFGQFNAADFDRDTLPLVLKSELQQADRQPPKKIILFSADGDTAETEDIADAIADEIELIKVSYNTHPLVVFCGQYKNALSLNLLQGEYKTVKKSNINWQRWGLAASLSAIWLVLHLGITITQNNTLEANNKKIQIEIDKIYKKAFPRSKRVVNARVQMEQKLDELKGRGRTGLDVSLIALLSEASVALASDKAISIQSISYRNSKVDIEVTGSKLQSIEQLNKKLNSHTLSAEIISSSSEKDQVKGHIRITRAKQS